LIVLLMTGLGACGEDASPEKREAPLPRLETVQSLAARECECRMAGRDSSRLAKEFNRLIARVDAHARVTSGASLSFQTVCLHKLGEQACFMAEANVRASPNDFVCTKGQVVELEAAYTQALPPGAKRASAAEAALMQRLQAMREELAAKLPRSACDRV
jgi:hypothetical protein